MPKAGEDAVLHLVVADGAPEMRADVRERLDLAVLAEDEDVMVAHPFGELPVRLQLGDAGEALVAFGGRLGMLFGRFD